MTNQSTSFGKALQVFLPFGLGYFISYVYRVINAVLAPNLAADVGVNPADLGLLTSAYFFTFAVFQVPLGVLLDRYGPRKIEALLLVVAAGGAWVFSVSSSLTGLVIGRGLIGLGVSACLMAAFKAFVIWFPRQQLPFINGLQMAAGGLGALAASVPVEAALAVTDWRGLFTLLGFLTLVVAAAIFWIVPEKRSSEPQLAWGSQIRGVWQVFTSLDFWRIAPWATVSQGSALAIHSLWAGPWLRDVAGLERAAVAAVLSQVAGAMIVGFIFIGAIAERLSRRGVRPMTVAVVGMGLFMGVLVMLIAQMTSLTTPIWIAFGFLGTSGIVIYAALSQSFPAEMAGRVNAALNLLVLVTAFAFQWGIGAVINRWPLSPNGNYAPDGYNAAFVLLLGLQVLTVGWYWVAGVIAAKGSRARAARHPLGAESD
jgi:MFS family permease